MTSILGNTTPDIDDAPWWARLGVREGLPTVLVLGLLYMLFGVVMHNLEAVSKDQELIIRHEVEILEQINNHSAAMGLLNRYVVCLAQASTPQERQRCAAEAIR